MNASHSARPRGVAGASARTANAVALREMAQPPHFGRVGMRDEHQRDDAQTRARLAHNGAIFDRYQKTDRAGGKAIVKV